MTANLPKAEVVVYPDWLEDWRVAQKLQQKSRFPGMVPGAVA